LSHQVHLAPQAILDIEEIHGYILVKEGLGPASKVLDGLQKSVLGLSRTPQRGHFPPELEGLGLTDIREIHFKPYRIVYQVRERLVHALVVADGRRDFQSLLSLRLVR
jgi:toxin ParE1/3/4